MVLSSSEKKAKESIRELLSVCRTLGIVINEKKSDLVPSQSAKYLGMTIDTGAGKVFPSLARVEKFFTVAERFCTMQSPPAQLWQVVLGHLASLERLVPHGRLRMRSLQWHLKSQWSPESDPPSLPVALPEEARRDLSWWMVRDHLLVGVRFGTPAPDLHLYSDASSSGWGAHLLDQNVSGVWSAQEKLLHINLLEMKALFLALQAFQEDVAGHHVTAMCDNSTVVAYVNKQGGTVSRPLCLLTSRLLRWTESFDVHLEARYLPGESNVLADVLSRRGQVVGTEWSLHPQVARALLRTWGNPVELRPPAWDVSLVLQSLTGAPYEPLRTCEERFLAQKTLFLLALASAKRIGELHALSYRVSHTRDWGEVSFAFVTGFVAKTQDPSSLAPRFEGFSVPALTNARKNRNGRLLCPVRAVKVYLDRTAPHRPRCERLFVTAGRSKKEISKTTVSFWLRKTISRAYELSWTALPVPAPRARETRGIAPSILFRKNFAVDQVLKAGTWRRHTTFTRHYLRDIAISPSTPSTWALWWRLSPWFKPGLPALT